MKTISVAFVALCAIRAAADFNVREFGAAEDAAPAANAAAIQRAVDSAAKDGGGRVVVPSGTFMSGTIWLKPNVELHLAEGSVLKASGDVADYNAEDAYPENWGCPPEQWRGLHFIIAREADGASITGPGTLHGNGDAFYDEKPKAYFSWMKPGASCWWNGIRWSKDKEKLRPGQLVAFVKCRNVAVRGITIRNSPCWSLWFWGCDGVQVSDYTVRNGENDGNSDGIDFDCSRNVVLERADIDTGDDAIAVRASARAFSPDGKGRLGLPAVTENVRIRDCRLRSTSSVIRIGVGEGVIRDVSFDNVTCDRGGTAVNISTRYGDAKRAGTDIERIVVRNSHFTNCRCGVAVRSNGGDRLEFGIRDIRFENCSFGGCKPVVESDRGVKFPVSSNEVTFVASPLLARTVAEWPLGCDEKGCPDGRCDVSCANDLLVMDVTHVGKLGDGRTALMATGGEEASDFAYSDVVGRYVTPTNDFTLEGWYSFARLPSKGETWMVASAFGGDNRWFLTLRRDSIHKGLTWQIFSGTPRTGDSLLTTITDPNTLTNGWHRFALTFAHRTAAGEAEWRFYLDGKPSGRCAVKAFDGTFNGGTRFALGGRGRCGNVIAGSLSDCRISDRVLTPAEFLQPDKAHVGTPCWKALPSQSVPDVPDGGRTLYNGIVLPKEWPPRIDPKDPNPIPAPYLQAENIPKVIPIDLGRQLFVDDFLIESTNGIVRAFGKPVKYEGNPVMWPETKAERGLDTELGDRPFPKDAKGKDWNALYKRPPGCAMSGGGVWWDPTRQRFRMWYMSGFGGRISYAESKDGLVWERPPVGPNGDNIVLPGQKSDTFSVFPGYDTDAPYDNWRICISPGGNPTRSAEYVSSDGIRWRFLRKTGQHGDCTTMFRNPFLGKWVWSLRAGWRHRSRIYHAHRDFYAGGGWHFPLGRPQTNTVDCALWLACDNQDLPRTMDDGKTYTNYQLYNVDAVAYESLMVGLFKILCGHENDEAARAGMPKTTSIHFAYSRDGFHFTRPDRTPAIDESGWGSGAWDSGYVGNISSCFAIKDERLWFYYVGARGDATQNDPPRCMLANGMHYNFSVGVATLRRDGFAGMVADGRGTLVTRPVTFSGAHLFVNADARFGDVSVDVLDEKGEPYAGYSAADCQALVRTDSTKSALTWKGGDLSRFAGKPVRFRFNLHTATLFSFWVSKKPTGESGGYVAAGGPDYKGLKDE